MITTHIVREIIKEAFPLEEQPVSLTGKLCYAIAYRDIQKISDLSEVIAQTDPTLFSQKIAAYSLTPLHVCSIVNDVPTARMLISNSVSLLPDFNGWTALHHAAVLQDEQMLSLLTTAFKTDHALMKRNGSGGTYQDLQRWIAPPRVSGNVFSYVFDQCVGEGDADAFHTATGAAYCPTVVMSPAYLLEEWYDPKIREQDERDPYVAFILENLREEYERFILTPPKLVLHKQNNVGYDVIADQDIGRGEVITVYGGMQKAREEGFSKDYTLDITDGKEMRNLGPMVNDGFPNAFAHVLYDVDGISSLSLLVASDPISKGERICWNYGSSHGVKAGMAHVELRAEAMEKFFESHPIVTWKEKVSLGNEEEDFQKTVEQISFGDKIRYLFQTPTSLLIGISKGWVSVDECLDLFQDEEFLSHLNNVEECTIDSTVHFLKLLKSPFLCGANQKELENTLYDFACRFSYTTLLVAIGFWSRYPISILSKDPQAQMKLEILKIETLLSVLHSSASPSLKMYRMLRVFYSCPTNRKEKLYKCMKGIIEVRFPELVKPFANLKQKIMRL